MHYLIKVISRWKFVFLVISFVEIDANILRRKVENKENDVIIITDFKGDSLANLLNQLKSNSSTRPISERIERTIKSNLKNNPLMTNLNNNQQNSNRFSSFSNLIDRARASSNKVSDKFSPGGDRLNANNERYNSLNDRFITDKTFYRPYTLSNGLSLSNANSMLNKVNLFNQAQNRYTTGYNYYTTANTPANSPYASKEQKYILAPLVNYPSNYVSTYPSINLEQSKQFTYDYNQPHKNYQPYTIKPTTYDTFTTKSTGIQQTLYRPPHDSFVKSMNYNSYKREHPVSNHFDLNKYLPASYDNQMVISGYLNSTISPVDQSNFDRQLNIDSLRPNSIISTQHVPLMNPMMSNKFQNHFNLTGEDDSDYDLTNYSNLANSSDDLMKRNLFDSYYRRGFPNARPLPRFPPSIAFRQHRFHPRKHNMLHGPFDSINSQLGNPPVNRFNNPDYLTDTQSPNQSNIISNELINSLINKLNERKLLNTNSPSTSDDKTFNSILSSNQIVNQLLNNSFDQDELLKNTQLLSKFEQINNKILTNLLLTTYLSNLNKTKMNSQLNRNTESFEEDSQDRLAESNVKYKVRHRSSQPSQIIIKKYIHLPASRKRMKKIQRKVSNIKSPVRPLIIKKIETPSIVIETPSSKLKKSLGIKRLNYLDEDGVEESLGYGTNLNTIGGISESGYEFDRLNNFNDLNGLNNMESTNYRLDTIGNGFKSSLFHNYPSYASANYALNRDLYLKKNKIDLNDQTNDENQFNDNQFNENGNTIKSRRLINNQPEFQLSKRRPFYHHHDHLPSTSIVSEMNSTVFNAPKRTIDQTPSDTFYGLSNRLSNDRTNNDDRFRNEERIREDRLNESEKLKNDEKLIKFLERLNEAGRLPNDDLDKLVGTNNFDKSTSDDKLINHRINEVESRSKDVANDGERYMNLEKLNNEINRFDSTNNSSNSNKVLYDLPENLKPASVPKLFIIDEST